MNLLKVMDAQYPKKLYKYQRVTLQTLKCLKSQKIYFGSPKQFNDPYDCSLTARVAIPTDAEIEEFRNHYLADSTVPKTARKEFKNSSVEQLRDIVLRAARTTVDQHIEHFMEHNGVTCFSEVNDDLLMWSHYSDGQRGICLEFDTDFEQFAFKLKKVRYAKEIPEIDAISGLIDEKNLDTFIEVLYCTKSASWEYEREWRALHNKAGTLYGYPSEALTGVYFGPEIDSESLEIICLILRGQNEHVRIYRGSRSKDNYKIEFEDCTPYLTYLEAKSLGLRD